MEPGGGEGRFTWMTGHPPLPQLRRPAPLFPGTCTSEIFILYEALLIKDKFLCMCNVTGYFVSIGGPPANMFDVSTPLYEGMPIERMYLPPPSHLTPPPTSPAHYPPSHQMGGTVGCRTIYTGHANGEFDITLSNYTLVLFECVFKLFFQIA